MDDKQFDELVKKYVGAHKQDEEKTLRKFRSREDTVEKKVFPKWAFALCACVLVTAVALSVFLPIFLKKNNNTTPDEKAGEDEIAYFDSSDTIRELAESKDALEEEFGRALPSLNMEYETLAPWRLIDTTDNNKMVGAVLSYVIYDDVFDCIEVTAFSSDLHAVPPFGFENPDQKTEYNGKEISYTVQEPGEEQYAYYVSFSLNDTDYYIEIATISEIDVKDVLAALF